MNIYLLIIRGQPHQEVKEIYIGLFARTFFVLPRSSALALALPSATGRGLSSH
jgi:hypothetical protein